MTNIKVVNVNKQDAITTADLVYALLSKELESKVTKRVTLSTDRIRKLLADRGVSVSSKDLVNHVESMLK